MPLLIRSVLVWCLLVVSLGANASINMERVMAGKNVFDEALAAEGISGKLAELARSLEASGHSPAEVGGFLMRCIFTMFAEDVRVDIAAVDVKSVSQVRLQASCV